MWENGRVMNSTGRGGRRARTWLALASLMGALVILLPVAAHAAGDPWDKDSHWVTVRAGVTKSGATLAPGGSAGYGFGYTWLLGKNIGWSATAGYDLLGKYGGAAEFEIPITTDFAKHFPLGPTTRLYMGLGWGVIYHKTYRTGADESGFRQGIYFATGTNMTLGGSNLVGVDFRYMIEQDTRSINPTFPNSNASGSVLSLKVSYSRVI